MSKNILITGTSSGFGRDTAETLAQAGHRVFASMRDVAGRNRPHAEALRAGHSCRRARRDRRRLRRARRDQVSAQAGRLDVLVNNAGIGSAGISEAFTTEQVRALFEVNVFGIHRTLRAVLPAFGARARAGRQYRLDPRPGDLPFFRCSWDAGPLKATDRNWLCVRVR